MHGCDEVNTGIIAITRQSRIIWWSYRYGTLSTPKTSPSADRVNKNTQGKHTRGDKRGQATIKQDMLQGTRETLAMLNVNRHKIAQFYQCTNAMSNAPQLQ